VPGAPVSAVAAALRHGTRIETARFRQEQKDNVPQACQVYLCMIMVRRACPSAVRTIWDRGMKPIPNKHDNSLFYR